ncbi:flavin reductase family protein [Streptomyces sp. NPDC048337]|uniref:flavin reductase family protein n=1 Tax=Streptomyces sp. NPDC048337 TaxID=3365535 RepID=UPI00371649FB
MDTNASTLRFDQRQFRDVLGHFCTGLTVIAATDGTGRPAGFACQSFASLSLDPPLVTFSVAATSSSWPRIERAGAFCATVLSAGQGALCRAFGTRGGDKFAGVDWSPAPATGSPRIGGALAWVDCEIESVLPGGDHRIVIGRVLDLDVSGEADHAEPLLFYRGAFLRPAAA